jgi:hypothetical protein
MGRCGCEEQRESKGPLGGGERRGIRECLVGTEESKGGMVSMESIGH